MIKHGKFPYLECSGEGYKPLSAFFAIVDGKSIEFVYQCSKIINGQKARSIAEGKGKKADNQEECDKIYGLLWDRYIKQRPELLALIRQQSGLSDKFGQPGHVCQATELWRIRNDLNFTS